jgi:two-component system OmpR family sensor kinase
MTLSLRWRLAIWIVVAFLLVMAAISVTALLSLQRIVDSDLDQGLSRDTERVLAQITLTGSLDDRQVLEQLVQENSVTGGEDSPFITVIWDVQGNVVASTPGLAVEEMVLSHEELARVSNGDTISRSVTLPGGQEFRVRTTRLAVGDVVLGVVQVGEATEESSRLLNRLQWVLIGEAIGGSIIALAVAYWLSRGALKPLQKVAEVAAEIEASDLSRRIDARGQPYEVQRLADTFDAMLERLDKAFREQRDFVLDVSHEMRTPLTALRGNIDVLLMSDSLDPEMRAHLESMSAETARLIRLTTNLLYLASADAGREPERRPVELDVLCLEVYRQAKELRPDVKVRLGSEDQVRVMGDRDLLKQMVLNITENAVKYSPPGGRVTLSLSKNGGQAMIVVEDTGPGIPPEQLPHVFERFFRGDDRGKMGGSGLGLAIAQWVATAHNGEIRVESELGRGSTFSAIIPIENDMSGDTPV